MITARGRRSAGFTIVELLIVVIVIAILAAITTVAYTGVQARAQDSKSRSAARQLETAIRSWAVNSGEQPKGGWSSTGSVGATGNCADGSGGWIESTSYSCSLEDMLRTYQLVPASFTETSFQPNKAYVSTATDGRYSAMFYPCGSNTGKYALYWYLQNPTADDTASIVSVEAQGCTSAPRLTYMMKAAKLITL